MHSNLPVLSQVACEHLQFLSIEFHILLKLIIGWKFKKKNHQLALTLSQDRHFTFTQRRHICL